MPDQDKQQADQGQQQEARQREGEKSAYQLRQEQRDQQERGWPDDETRGEVLGKPSGSVGIRSEDMREQALKEHAEAQGEDGSEQQERGGELSRGGAAATGGTVERECPECKVRGPHDVLGEGDGPGMSKIRCQSCGSERDGRLSAEEKSGAA